jgi:ankyrin repeat protein
MGLFLAYADKNKFSLQARDEFGWKPIHHAVLSSSVIFDLLINTGASPYDTHYHGS